MSKAQITGQVFIYIMAAIIIGILILMGYQAIQAVVVNSCNAEKLVFMNRIFQYIERSSSYGSVAKYNLAAPCGYEQICFIDSSKIGQGSNNCNISILHNSALDGDQKNIFVRNSKTIVPAGYSSKISLGTKDCICIMQNNNQFNLLLEGLGSKTQVSSQ